MKNSYNSIRQPSWNGWIIRIDILPKIYTHGQYAQEEKFLKLVVIREMQMNTTTRHLTHYDGLTRIKKTDYTKSCGVGRKIKWCSKFGKHFPFFKMLNIHFPQAPAIPHLKVYLWEMQTCPHTCKRIITAPLLITAPNWKQPKCPSGWMSRHPAVCPYTGVLLSNGEEQSTETATTRGKLEPSCERVTPDAKDYMSPNSIYMKFLEKAKLWRLDVGQWLPWAESGSGDWLPTTKRNFWKCWKCSKTELQQWWQIYIHLLNFIKQYSYN